MKSAFYEKLPVSIEVSSPQGTFHLRIEKAELLRKGNQHV